VCIATCLSEPSLPADYSFSTLWTSDLIFDNLYINLYVTARACGHIIHARRRFAERSASHGRPRASIRSAGGE